MKHGKVHGMILTIDGKSWDAGMVGTRAEEYEWVKRNLDKWVSGYFKRLTKGVVPNV